jgi:hypothetical protein
MKIETIKLISVQEFNELVRNTYGRQYHFQQQDGCKERGKYEIVIPATPEDYDRENVPEVVNHSIMGVKFESWLSRDPKQLLTSDNDRTSLCLELWWKRNFYPHVSMVVNDLYSKGLIEAGEYLINVDW